MGYALAVLESHFHRVWVFLAEPLPVSGLEAKHHLSWTGLAILRFVRRLPVARRRKVRCRGRVGFYVTVRFGVLRLFYRTEREAILTHAATADQYVEVNALVGQCSPSWLYTAAGGVPPLKVNWKPPPQCVPPECVPAGTWEGSRNGGQGCGCDGAGWPPLTKCTIGAGCGCNQTFPDYLSPHYKAPLTAWVQAPHAHGLALEAVAVQVSKR